jgi:hypothetical protein
VLGVASHPMKSLRFEWSAACVAVSIAALAGGCGQSTTSGGLPNGSSSNGGAGSSGGGGSSSGGGGTTTGGGGSSTNGTGTGTGASTGSGSTGSGSTSTGQTTTAGGDGGTSGDDSVLMLHKNVSHDGLYIQPSLNKTVAAAMHKDATFSATIAGNVYAQPLYVQNGPGGKGIFIVATESNTVYAVSDTGAPVWNKTIGTPAGASGAGCGNITPLGITGTPAIDLPSRTLFLSAAVGTGSTIQRHEIHALSIDDGTEKTGFPVDTTKLSSDGVAFNPVVQNQRGALLIVNGTLYVPYGGHAGDCGQYRGWIVGVPLTNPAGAMAWATMAKAGGIWAVGGPASDGTDVFATTGNTYDIGMNPAPTVWGQGDAVLRFHGLPTLPSQTADYFYPSNWASLDVSDGDLGGTAAIPVNVPGATPSSLIVALGKNGVAYLLNRANLGGKGTGNGTTGEGLTSVKVASSQIMNAPASYTTAGGTYVVFNTTGMGTGCPPSQSGNLVALKIGATNPPSITVAWCSNNQGRGSPIVTTTDGKANAIVWAMGAGTSNRLHGFDGDTGAAVFTGGGANDTVAAFQYFNSPIAAKGRIIVAANASLVAFTSP